MSGIGAVWQKESTERIASTLLAVHAGLAAGDDEQGTRETVDGVGIAVQARSADQDLHRTNRVLLACDVDLLNVSELVRTAGLTDRPGVAALLATLYEQRGEKFLDVLRGGFAIVLWDLVERRLLAAVDRFGIKRLAWYDDGKSVIVASRVDAVRAGAGDLAVNPRAVANIVNFTSNLGPETIFKGVHRLAPGTWLIATERQTRQHAYWELHYGVGRDSNEGRLSREMESVLQQSVADHAADTPPDQVGAFLSGGTDSSTVVGLLTRAAGAPVNAFSIGFAENGFDELDYAKLAAQSFGARHHTYLVNANDCFESLPRIVRCFDEPFGNSSSIATYFCARLAKDNGVHTLLAGDGGDELFGGNERYATEKIFEAYKMIPAPLRAGVVEPLAALPIDITLTRRARGYIRRAKMPGVERMLSFQFLRTHEATDVFDGDFVRALDGYTILDIPSEHYTTAKANTHLDRLLYVDLRITLADSDLPKVTCMSDMADVRTRFPFLDASVAEFSGRVPAHLKVKGLKKRYLFKQAFRNLLPPQIIQKKKHGFGVPVAVWMRTDPRLRELTHDTLLSSRASGRGYFKQSFIRELLERHESGTDTFYGDTLWAFLMLELWHLQSVDEPARVVA